MRDEPKSKIVPVRPNRPELAVFRKTNATEEDWLQLITAFSRGNQEKRDRYASAVRTFLGKPTDDKSYQDYLGKKSPHTRRHYSYAVQEFFEWIAHKHSKIIPPEAITRADAADYVNYLANARTFKPTLEKVKDPDRGLDLELVAVISRLQQKFNRIPKFIEIITELRGPKEAEKVLADPVYRTNYRHQLGRLVVQEVLKSDPTVSELRDTSPPGRPDEKPYADAGITLWEIDGQPYDCAFGYAIVDTPKVQRSTIASKLAALSSFWKVLMLGDNTEKGAPILKYNVWDEQKVIVNRGLKHETKASADTRIMSDETVLLMLEHCPAHSLIELRDKAILYLMCFCGLRAQEVIQIVRGEPRDGQAYGWFIPDERPKLRLTAKGNKHRVIVYPPAALKALTAFQVALEQAAAPLNAQSDNPHGANYIHPKNKAWYYQQLCFETSPLFPPLEQWGNNYAHKGRIHHMGLNCLASALKRIAKTIRFRGDDGHERGLTKDEVKKVHPHAFRHFAATAAHRQGMALEAIQTLLGHGSPATTSGYFTQEAVVETAPAQQVIMEYLEKVAAERTRRQVTPLATPPAKTPEKPARVIDTVGKAVAVPVPKKDKPGAAPPAEGLTPPVIEPQLAEVPEPEPEPEEPIDVEPDVPEEAVDERPPPPPKPQSIIDTSRRVKKPVRPEPRSRPLVELAGPPPAVAYDEQADKDLPYAFEKDMRLYRFHALRVDKRKGKPPIVFAWFSPEAEPDFRHVEVWDGETLYILPESNIVHLLKGPYKRPDWFEKLCHPMIFDPKQVFIDEQENFDFGSLQDRWKSAFDSASIPWQQFK